MHDLNQVRKALIWGLPFLVGMMAACSWMFVFSVIPATRELLNLAPAVRVGALGYLTPLVGLTSVITAVLLILRAIPYQGRAYQVLEYINVGTIFGGFAALLLILTTSTLLQSHYMPKLGYSKCNELQGNPTLWFTDWVKNPDWCVRGKTREWVNEQAKLAQAAS